MGEGGGGSGELGGGWRDYSQSIVSEKYHRIKNKKLGQYFNS